MLRSIAHRTRGQQPLPRQSTAELMRGVLLQRSDMRVANAHWSGGLGNWPLKFAQILCHPAGEQNKWCSIATCERAEKD